MPKFILHRIVRMNQNPSAENITPGLEAAMYLHWLSCHEHDPQKFDAIGPQVRDLKKQVADYFDLTAQETAAHLELMAATADGGDGVQGTKDFNQAAVEPKPGRVVGGGVQLGYNWVLLYWDAPADGGKPWGYRVYRKDLKSAPVLVATVCDREALLPDQPEQVKLYYYTVAFNGSGEGPPGIDVGVMLNAPDQGEAAAARPLNFPERELPIRRELGAAMLTFVQKVGAAMHGDDEDSVMRQVATEEYRQAVEKAARQGVGNSLCWHTLATWAEEGKDRIGYFSRALECLKAESEAAPASTPKEEWSAAHTEADCLFEIGRVHFHEGTPEAAHHFLSQALTLAQKADALRAAAGIDHDDRLEGRIAELLLQLPDEP